MKTLSKYASLVRFAHTIFALPFALTGYFYAGGEGDWTLLAKILLCMVFARNAAMGFNRWADRKFDAANPRTADREIPSGKISPRKAIWFIIVNATLFIASAGLINHLTLLLAPVALVVILGYSLTKRFTWWCHIVLGVALGIAPAGAYMAVTGTLNAAIITLSAAVAAWVAGFDILYSMQDADYDRTHGLHSIPARFSAGTAKGISIALHALSIVGIAFFGRQIAATPIYWVGAALFALPLVAEHTLPPARLFTTLNGISSILFAACAILSIVLR